MNKDNKGFLVGVLLVVGCVAAMAASGMWNQRLYGTTTVDGNMVVTGTVANTGAITQTGALTLGTNGTSIAELRHGRVTVANGQTSNTLTLSGTAASDRVLATITGTNTNSRYVKRVVAGTNTVQVILSGDPGADTTVDVLAIKP